MYCITTTLLILHILNIKTNIYACRNKWPSGVRKLGSRSIGLGSIPTVYVWVEVMDKTSHVMLSLPNLQQCVPGIRKLCTNGFSCIQCILPRKMRFLMVCVLCQGEVMVS